MSPVFGKDVNVLIRVLYAAFVAEQGSATCMVSNINLSESDRVIFINAKNYAQRIKQKVSTDLSDEDVRDVLKSTADRAREEMLDVVRVLKSNPPEKEDSELFRWCTTNMKVVADEVVRAYVDHPTLLISLSKTQNTIEIAR
jgi:hypothetical protein